MKDTLKVVKTFSPLDGPLTFYEGEIWLGHWKYVSSIDKETELPLVVICSSIRGPYLLPKEYFEKI